jgi:integrase
MHRVPKLCVHRSKRLAYVRLAGHQVYLGPAHSPEAHARYAALLADWRAGVPIEGAPPASAVKRLTMAEVAEAYLLHCVAKYGPKSKTTYQAKYVARELLQDHAAARIADFGPRAFRMIRDRMQADGRSRQWTNRLMNAIRGCIRWAVSEEMAPADRLQALECVAGLRHGDAPEAPPRTAADPAAVEACIRHLDATGQAGASAIIRFLRATGCRPGEACAARWPEFTLDARPTFRPRHHKTARLGIERVVPLNADALAAVRDLMRPGAADGAVFLNTNGEPFRPNAILLAVNRAIEATGCVKWSPYGLRHLAATAALAATGSEAAAAALLGHTPRSTIIQRYSRDRLALAWRAADGIEQRRA